MENIINEKFIDFLIKAKKSTYANSTIEKVRRCSESFEIHRREGKAVWLRLKISHRRQM